MTTLSSFGSLFFASPRANGSARPKLLTLPTAVLISGILALCGTGQALAQSQITPGAPSLSLTPAAAANGVQDRITRQYGIEFVTIGAPGNAPWMGNGSSSDVAIGRGSVDHEYRIGRFEVTTSQWAAFMSAVYARPATDAIPFISPPNAWGGVIDSTYHGPGRRYVAAPGREMNSVGNISWRTAAIYCNWLHNGQASDRSAFMNGAYDVSTFGYIGGSSVFTDQLVHNPDAQFFIPNIDEWTKAAHYDPNKNGMGQGGWWKYSTTSDTTPVYAPPGILQNGRLGQSSAFASTATSYPGYGPSNIMLGAYSDVQSPWGLLDTSGGRREWNEDAALFFGTLPVYRYIDSSAWGDDPYQANVSDQISYRGTDYASSDFSNYGFRIAAAIPSPSGIALFGMMLLIQNSRRRKE